MECLRTIHDSKEGVAFDFFASDLTREFPDAVLQHVQLRYVPEYIRKLRDKTEQWKGDFLEFQDSAALTKWRNLETQYEEEVKKHKTILTNLDNIRRKYVSGDRNHFTQSLDGDFIQAVIGIIKENESDDNIFYRLTTPAPGMARDITYVLYVIYAFVALYGEFRMRPLRQSGLRVKPWATLVQLRVVVANPREYEDSRLEN